MKKWWNLFIQKILLEDVERKLNQESIFLAMGDLTDREKYIMSCRYGLSGEEEMTQKEVADHLGISQSYISLLEKRSFIVFKRFFAFLDKITHTDNGIFSLEPYKMSIGHGSRSETICQVLKSKSQELIPLLYRLSVMNI